MDTLTLCGNYSSAFTFVQNDFIDYYMRDINESQIKIYLYLLRASGSNIDISVSSIADFFNDSERDVIRALKYLDKQKLINLEYGEDKKPAGIRLLRAGYEGGPVLDMTKDMISSEEGVSKASPDRKLSISDKNSYSTEDLLSFRERNDIKELVYVAETYLKRTLSPNDLSSLLFMNDRLGFNTELIEYLIEYCVSSGKKTTRFIDKTAMAWFEKGISDVEEAKAFTTGIPGEARDVLDAFGIGEHEPSLREIAFVNKWTKQLCFSLELIKEAISRTLLNINEPSFEYADRILESWKAAEVESLADIKKLDEAFMSKKKASSPKRSKKSLPDKASDDPYSAFARDIINNKKKGYSE